MENNTSPHYDVKKYFFFEKYYFPALENVSAEETAVVLDLDQANKTGGWDDTVDLAAEKKALPIVFSARIASSHKRKKKRIRF